MPTTEVAASAARPALSLGVDVSSGFYEQAPIAAFEVVAGQRVNVVQNFISWGYNGGAGWNLFPTRRVGEILARASTPEISWDPTVNGDGANQPKMNLASIAAGTDDHYIIAFAEAARAVGGVIFIRFAHEMNGSWNSYAESNSGNHPGDFVRAWRHVHDLFVAAGATNVRWIWSPNVVSAGSKSLASLYPGDNYVDYVGVDGYSYPLAGCKTAQALFGPTLANIESFTARPMMLSEVAVSSACPEKAAWMNGFFKWLEATPNVQGFTWWNRTETANDWRADSSPQSTEAFARGLRNYQRSTLPDGNVQAESVAALKEVPDGSGDPGGLAAPVEADAKAGGGSTSSAAPRASGAGAQAGSNPAPHLDSSKGTALGAGHRASRHLSTKRIRARARKRATKRATKARRRPTKHHS